ncbi:jerky protein homolog-like [Colletes gigas]|uniref:jerky protein homolog-like n=1 Tax=Colletes gigas TaxID=935657 RepID=UPI001C9A35F7|nr:jerky protein homolog-like [Colletes gigas]XP_043258433.1 jerky protein homolog-like [Colletes gigas]XP_043258434.1 jerky protein homolog-like [Colletes gigas]
MLAGQTKSRVYLSLKQRLDILRQLEDGVSMTQLAKEYEISDATIRRIRSQADQIRKQSQTPGIKDRKKFSKPKLEKLDASLHAWYQDQRVLDDCITDAILKEKAIELNKELGGPSTFTASKGWIWRFKHRHGISFRELNSENVNVDTRETEKFIQCFLQCLEEKGVEMQNVYSMDETGLMWKAFPRKTLIDATARRVYGKRIKQNRVTVGLCANAIGTHKLPPLFIHRCETPKALKHCKDRLSVVFKAQKNACLDQTVFTDWLEKHFKPAVRKYHLEAGIYGKVLLLVDKCRAHMLSPQLQLQNDNVEVVYLPTDTSLYLHPMQQGIMKSVKVSFRRRILNRILDFPGGVAEFYTDYDVKDCIDLVSEAWTDVTQVDIYNSWKKLVGYDATLLKGAREGQNNEHPYNPTDISSIKDTLKAIINETVSDKQVEKWLSICENVERDPDEFELEEEDFPIEKPDLHRDEDEIDRTIAKLILWSEGQSDFVKLHARLVKDYYDLVQR